MKLPRLFSRIAPLAVMGLLVAVAPTLSACSPLIVKNGDSVTVDTVALRDNAAAVLVAAQNIVAIPAVKQHLTTDQLNQANDIISQVKSVTAEIAQSSDGAITIDVSKKWAGQLSAELGKLLEIAQPIVAQYDTKAATYVGYAQQLVAIVQVIAGQAPVAATPIFEAGGLKVYPQVDAAPVVRAKIFLGPQA